MGNHSSFWGKYDVRAVVGEQFGPAQYHEIGKAYARFLNQQLGQPHTSFTVAVGHDARLHSLELTDALVSGLIDFGVNVVRLGLCTSPIVYFSEHLHALNPEFPELAGTIMVTASHNPSEYNGVKFTFQKRTLTETEFAMLQTLCIPQQATAASAPGSIQDRSILEDYIAWFEQHFGKVGQGIRVVVDSGNATAGIAAPEVLRRLGCDVIDIFTEPDGRFPNHHPDPCVHKNLVWLSDKVRETKANFGVAFDGDADRLGIVEERGEILPGDQITMFLAADLLAKEPDQTIVFDIKGTQTLFDYIRQLGGNPLLAPSGHAYMKRIMRDQDIPLGGELSGHIFFRDRHWGFDDALYAACRVIEAFAHQRQKKADYQLSDFTRALPQTRISEEIRAACSREVGQKLMADLQKTVTEDPNFFGSPAVDILTLDGLRVNIHNGFFLVRASGTEPCVTLRFEAPDESTYQHIEKRVQEICASLSNPVATPV